MEPTIISACNVDLVRNITGLAISRGRGASYRGVGCGGASTTAVNLFFSTFLLFFDGYELVTCMHTLLMVPASVNKASKKGWLHEISRCIIFEANCRIASILDESHGHAL